MYHDPEIVANLRSLLAEYSRSRRVEVVLHEMDYGTGWAEFIRTAVHGGGPDVSEVGTTWLSDFVAMNALQPFAPAELQRVGSAKAFVPAVWHSGLSAENEVWAIPWLTDVSVVYYRRDWLAKAGVDEKAAFQTSEQFEQTLKQLQAAGVEMPWTAPTRRSYISLHNLSLWLWDKGGNYVDSSGKRLLIGSPEFRAALRAYFSLYRYLAPAVRNLSETESDDAFLQGKAAVDISGPWLMKYCSRTPEVAANLGIAVPFGCSYVGGSSLVIWKTSKPAQETLELIAYLVSRNMQTVFPKCTGMLPARLDALGAFPVPDPAMSAVLMQALKTGRALPNIGLWGTIEDRLVGMLARLGEDVLAAPEPNLEALIDKHLLPVISRLNLAFA
jgi:multiple sugar transport system substrate-binding protein